MWNGVVFSWKINGNFPTLGDWYEINLKFQFWISSLTDLVYRSIHRTVVKRDGVLTICYLKIFNKKLLMVRYLKAFRLKVQTIWIWHRLWPFRCETRWFFIENISSLRAPQRVLHILIFNHPVAKRGGSFFIKIYEICKTTIDKAKKIYILTPFWNFCVNYILFLMSAII